MKKLFLTIIAFLILPMMVIALILFLMGINHIEFDNRYFLFLRTVATQFDDFKLTIPDIPKIPNIDNVEGILILLDAVITFFNGFISILNIFVTVINYFVQLIQFLMILVKALFVDLPVIVGGSA